MRELEKISPDTLSYLCDIYDKNNYIDPEYYNKYDIKRGLRNIDGSGVRAGLTQICNVHGYVISEAEQKPVDGILTYRGINVRDLVIGCKAETRYGFEETIWLLLFGSLPTKKDLDEFADLLSCIRKLPSDFVEDVLIKNPSPNIMNKLASAILSLYPYDENPEDLSKENLLKQSIRLISILPIMMVYAYQAKRRHCNNESLFIHPLIDGISTSEAILRAVRDDMEYTKEEAMLLDLCLILHAEHGGGNNSTFAARVLSSSSTDTYSAISAAFGSLKGPKHGGANIKVTEMMSHVKENVKDWENEDEIAAFLEKIIKKESGDGSGLIYGMGHAVYTLSDPRAVILKQSAFELAEEKGFGEEFRLIELVEKLTPEVFEKVKGIKKTISANVDMYSGLVYKSLGISEDLFTPMFAIARMPGWCAHRIEEISSGGRIIRPAYKSIAKQTPYTLLSERK